MNDRMAYLTSALYFVGGALAGAGVALLMAPQAGKVTRDMMRRKARETADSALHLRDRMLRRGEEIRDEAAHRVTDAASALAGHGSRELRGQNEAVSA